MKYDKVFMGSYNLHLINTDKFKTVTVEVDFRNKLENDTTIRNLLKMVLLDSNKNFKTERELVKETENLYDLKLVSSNNRIGTNTNMTFKIRFLEESYTEKSMNEESILLLFDIIFNPNITNDSFDEKIVNKCKEKLKKSIISIKDNKLKYALLKLFETTKDMPYSRNGYGDILELEKIDGKILYDYYKKMLKNDMVDVFVVGNIDNDKIKELFREKFKIETFKKTNNGILVNELDKRKRINKVQVFDEVNQTQLTYLCSLHNLTDFERSYVIKVYNEILGGGSNSLLFSNVREKNSLAYYINSADYNHIQLAHEGQSLHVHLYLSGRYISGNLLFL